MSSTRRRLEALTANLSLPEERVRESPAAAPDDAARADVPAAAVVQETRFPPAVRVGVQGARTGPGQMMAFRGQMQQVESDMAALREKLGQYEGSLPTRKMDPQRIRPSRWANRHESAFATSEFAGLKADIEHAGGNVQPILVRAVADEADVYELVFGHRRHRACLELGIPVLASIWIGEMGDAALFAAMDRENRERADLSAYEQGVMYQRALDENLFPTQRQLADNLGVSHTWIRKALMVAQLPSVVMECFRSPLEVNFRHAEQINAAMEKDRRAVLKRAEKLRGQGLSAPMAVARLLDAKPGFERLEKVEIQGEGIKFGTLSRNKLGEISIGLTSQGGTEAPLEALSAAIMEALRKVRQLN